VFLLKLSRKKLVVKEFRASKEITNKKNKRNNLKESFHSQKSVESHAAGKWQVLFVSWNT